MALSAGTPRGAEGASWCFEMKTSVAAPEVSSSATFEGITGSGNAARGGMTRVSPDVSSSATRGAAGAGGAGGFLSAFGSGMFQAGVRGGRA